MEGKLDSTGIDISSYRMDTLERKAVEDFLSFDNASVMVNLGSGHARSSVVLALLGYRTRNYDVANLGSYFKKLADNLGIPTSRLRFDQTGIEYLSRNKLPDIIHGVIANRVLHYLKYSDAVRLLQSISKQLHDDAQVYIGLSGMDTELGRDYAGKYLKLEKRLCCLDKQIQQRFQITEPICLYKKKDVEQLAANSGLAIKYIEQSKFGNWKVVCNKM